MTSSNRNDAITRSDDEMVAYALEIHPQLLPFVPELLVDFDELGSDAKLIVEMLETLNLPSSAQVIDLGCGKGAVTFEIARKMRLQVTGVDLFEPFIKGCRAEATLIGLNRQCRFVCGNIMHLASEIEPSDVAIFAALGDVLGPLDQTVSIIRNYVRPGGYLLISDGYLKDNDAERFAGFENYSTREETLKALISCGDILLKERCEPAGSSDEEDEESDLILNRAKVLSRKHPELADVFLEYAESQRSEYVFLRNHFVSTIWVLQRIREGI